MVKLEAYEPNLPIQEDRIHVANGTLFLSGKFNEHKDFCRNRLPVKYNPNAPQPVTWLRFLSELLEELRDEQAEQKTLQLFQLHLISSAWEEIRYLHRTLHPL